VTNLSIRIHSFVVGLLNRERGQDLIEYALLGGLIAAGILAVTVLFNDAIDSMITGIGNCIDFSDTTLCDPDPF
jgi:Flp pilus assembly pilin Flp